jgi:ubiquinone/menaquinone biosynthesis C-methylase UbiE
MSQQPRSNIEWQSWGKSDPLYGVASLEGRNRRGQNPWTEIEFYAYGAQNWAEYSRQWESYGVHRESCVEIGCGAGRITRQLSSYFQQVQAIDVSRDMIERARLQVNPDRVDFHVTDGAVLPLADGSVTAAFSCDVFQHFNSAVFAENYFAEIFRVLSPGGSIMIHLPVFSWPGAMRRSFSGLYSIWQTGEALKAEVRRQLLRIRLGNPFMFGIKYESKRLHESLGELGFRDIEIRFFENSGNGGRPDLRSYLFARKPIATQTKQYSVVTNISSGWIR